MADYTICRDLFRLKPDARRFGRGFDRAVAVLVLLHQVVQQAGQALDVARGQDDPGVERGHRREHVDEVEDELLLGVVDLDQVGVDALDDGVVEFELDLLGLRGLGGLGHNNLINS